MATATSAPKLDWIHEVDGNNDQTIVVTKDQRIRWRGIARKYIARYKNYLIFEDNQPTVVAWYETDMRYGGPEEGGWYYEQGWPIQQVCVFSRKQAIREAIRLHEEALQDAGQERDYLGWNTFSIDYRTEWAQPYPTVKPHYC